MRVVVEFTHQNGRKRSRGRSSEPLVGELRTHEMRTPGGSYKVATLQADNVTHGPLVELYDVKLFCVSPQGMHLRGMERIGPAGEERFVLQGWLVTDARDHWTRRQLEPSAGLKSLE
ncbi:hypothetical protein SOM08_06285 [Hydrogenophaga sp. SNF1]|uniref:hypothetical protein n=1 Tax=Hydrogenophaga sp. SNF1 TaxID=3098762 RepID=UPI002ACBF519|nr:hypothetical protein [Hydrogenophaga sp. SNF1]WQB84920.1 hypothetical protein SOM08_06285 [Hydrogenophaga sp. SNF1]